MGVHIESKKNKLSTCKFWNLYDEVHLTKYVFLMDDLKYSEAVGKQNFCRSQKNNLPGKIIIQQKVKFDVLTIII